MSLNYIRKLKSSIESAVQRGKSVLLLGARQTGKTTLMSVFDVDLSINLMLPSLRRVYESDPSALERELNALNTDKMPLVLIDEVQKVPELLDIAQVFIDEKKAQFLLTGSSARKLREKGVNLLPGRVVSLRLDPLLINELGDDEATIEDILYFGMLPNVRMNRSNQEREQDLLSYVGTYIEDEIRAEALVRQIGPFNRFLELACADSNLVVNLSKLSKDIGVPAKTIDSYFQILEDCLIAERIEPLIEITSKRRQLIKSNRYLIFDQGVRRISAKEGLPLPIDYLGRLYEQFIGQQLIGLLRQIAPLAKVKFWRDSNGGVEVDWVIEFNKQYLPIEVKMTDKPILKDGKHLRTFMSEHECPWGALILCQISRPQQFDGGVLAISWKDLPVLLNKKLNPSS